MSDNQDDDFAIVFGAAMDSDSDAIQTILAAGKNIDALNAYGKSALHMAILNSSPGMVDFLLRHGADPQSSTSAGETALELARQMERWQILSLLEKQAERKEQITSAKKNE